MSDLYVIFGKPIEHSLSPAIHNALAKIYNQDMVFEKRLINPDEFDQTLNKFFTDGGKGCSITIPCKRQAYQYADFNEKSAQLSQSVNVLSKNEKGLIIGDNTDGAGFILDLKRLHCRLAKANVLLIGAGGAGHGLLHPLLNENVNKVVIVDVFEQYAKDLALQVQDVKVSSFPMEILKPDFDLIINASSTSINNTLPDISDDVLSHANFVYDIFYTRSGNTIFTDKAKALGVKDSYDGLGMLVMQACLAFEKWRRVKVDYNKVYDIISDKLVSR